MTIALGRDIYTRELAEALGLQDKRVIALDIHLATDETAKVTVSYHVEGPPGKIREALLDALEHYELRKIGGTAVVSRDPSKR